MKNYGKLKKVLATVSASVLVLQTLVIQPVSAGSNNIIYPLKEISKLECRFKEFSQLNSDCKQSLPKLRTKDYSKYAKLGGGYNDFTRLYTVLWASSYKYGWDVGNGGHMGVDIATAKGTPIYAMADGKVIVAKTLTALGKNVSIEHYINGKKIVSNYSHMSKINAKVGQKVKAGTKIGEVGSTGNSTGNHLHFQIDLPNTSYPAYYNYKTCPYSYYKISEQGLCFNELKRTSVDPLLFLETSGAIVDKITVTNVAPKNTNKSSSSSKNYDASIFNRTVYAGYNVADIKKVQAIFRDLGEYKGSISGDYRDIESTIISYQLSNRIIHSKSENGAGWFGPKTRKQAKHHYEIFIKKGGKPSKTTDVASAQKVESQIKTQKISRTHLLSREEIEAKEVEEFTNRYNIELNFRDIGGNVEVGKATILKLKVTDKRGKPFKGNMPGGMTFVVDDSKVSMFPKKLYNFTDGKRDITITGLKAGNIVINIKIGNKTIKRVPIKVYNGGQTIYPTQGSLIASKQIVIGDSKTGIVLFKDNAGQKLINIAYGSTFTLKTNDDIEVCIKKGSLKNIKNIYKRKCSDSQYTKSPSFSYKDTVGGLLIFDYKATGKNASLDIVNNYNKNSLANKNLAVQNPKGLNNTYAYKESVLETLEQGITDGINKGYFLEKRGLTQYDALSWVKNTLIELEKTNPQIDIDSSINDINTQLKRSSKHRTVSREDFLNLSYRYLVFTDNNGVSIKYKDLSAEENKKANAIFSSNTTWKDKFGANYYRPEEKITRGEAAYKLSTIISRSNNGVLATR